MKKENEEINREVESEGINKATTRNLVDEYLNDEQISPFTYKPENLGFFGRVKKSVILNFEI